MRRRALIAASLLVVAGCGADGGGTVEEAAGEASPSVSASSPEEAESSGAGGEAEDPERSPETAGEETSEPPRTAVPASLQFRAETVDGQPFSGASLAGKPVLLWFWAPWCPTCRGQIPEVQDIEARYGDKVSVVGVGSLDDASAIAGFADDVAGPIHLTDVDGSVWRHFGVVEQSSFVLLDAAGNVALEAGYGGADDLADQVAALAG
ncbi:MAG: redoxin family protein [Nocardioides sp.]